MYKDYYWSPQNKGQVCTTWSTAVHLEPKPRKSFNSSQDKLRVSHQLLPGRLHRQHRGSSLISLKERKTFPKMCFLFVQLKMQVKSQVLWLQVNVKKPGFAYQMYFSQGTLISLPWSSCFRVIIIITHQLLWSLLLPKGMHRCNQTEFCLLEDQCDSFANSWTHVLTTAKSNICVKFQSQLRLAHSWELGSIWVMKQIPGEPQPSDVPLAFNITLWRDFCRLRYPSCHSNMAVPTPALSGCSRGTWLTVCTEGSCAARCHFYIFRGHHCRVNCISFCDLYLLMQCCIWMTLLSPVTVCLLLWKT